MEFSCACVCFVCFLSCSHATDVLGSQDLGDFSSEDALSFVAGIRSIEDRLNTQADDVNTSLMSSPELRLLANQIATSLLRRCPVTEKSGCPIQNCQCCCQKLCTTTTLPYDDLNQYAGAVAGDVLVGRASQSRPASVPPSPMLGSTSHTDPTRRYLPLLPMAATTTSSSTGRSDHMSGARPAGDELKVALLDTDADPNQA